MNDITRNSLTEQEVSEYTDTLARHYGEPVMPVSDYCAKLFEYIEALENATLKGSSGPFGSLDDAETVKFGLILLKGWAQKSNCLARLLYGNEKLRKNECPIHKGKWSGCGSTDCGCDDGPNITGWLKKDK